MLSILIPTYNYDCFSLAAELHQQATNLGIKFEILVFDDASTNESTALKNKKINTIPGCKYYELEENVGRARIRNLLAEHARYEYLLFLDSDVRVCYDDFLAKYLENRSEEAVVCGTTRFVRRTPEPNRTLRYMYGISGEEKSAASCNKCPHAQFTSISFLLNKNVFTKVRFNEEFVRYGHEDTLFGKELEKQGIPVIHIENPIYHNVPDTNEVFLMKTRHSIQNSLTYKEILESHVRLLQVYNKVNKYHLGGLVLRLYKLNKTRILSNLMGAHPNMKLFAFYKLGYLCELAKQSK